MSFLWPRSGVPHFTSGGAFASGAQASFFEAGTTTPIAVYSDAGFLAPHTIPVFSDQNGVFPGVFIPYGAYRQRIVDQDGVLLDDTDNIDNFAPPSSGGGIVVTQDMVLQTGDPIWRPRSGIMQGFVRMNGNTIGSAVSAATEFASASASALFAHLWTTLTDALATVSGGRGASGSADFAANKTIVVPTMAGYLAAGLDDMGAGAAGVLQAITTCTTNSTTTIVVASSAGIAVGDIAIVGGVSLGAVVSVVGTTVVVTIAAGSSGSGVSFRSSRFADATLPGNAAGLKNANITIAQLPSHTHALTDPGHTHTELSPNGVVGAGGAAVNAGTSSVNTGSATTGITIANTGGGNPLPLLQPTRLGTWYIKL